MVGRKSGVSLNFEYPASTVTALAAFHQLVVFHKPVSCTYQVWRAFNPAAESATNSAARLGSGAVGCARPAPGTSRTPNRSASGIRRFIGSKRWNVCIIHVDRSEERRVGKECR